ncbi:unannotated protein [freshwater metagenome]|uniref:Unannotated protein n=2 Tax=freshwater metagenome TaxID=449393 RepID=A0A6J6RM56_9ZZZZ
MKSVFGSNQSWATARASRPALISFALGALSFVSVAISRTASGEIPDPVAFAEIARPKRERASPILAKSKPPMSPKSPAPKPPPGILTLNFQSKRLFNYSYNHTHALSIPKIDPLTPSLPTPIQLLLLTPLLQPRSRIHSRNLKKLYRCLMSALIWWLIPLLGTAGALFYVWRVGRSKRETNIEKSIAEYERFRSAFESQHRSEEL